MKETVEHRNEYYRDCTTHSVLCVGIIVAGSTFNKKEATMDGLDKTVLIEQF